VGVNGPARRHNQGVEATGEIWDYDVRRTGDVSTVVLSGELDVGARDTLTDVLLAEVERPGTSAVTIDLGGVTFLDSTTMSVLIKAYLTAEADGRRLTVDGAGGLVRRNLETAGLLDLLSG
jgi:anti-sigma B factor antagonist